MIGPTTKVFGLVMSDPRSESHVARLYNYLLGFNGLDGAYLTFFLQPKHVDYTLTGFSVTRRTALVHVVPAHQAAAATWAGATAPVDTLDFSGPEQKAWLRDASDAWLSPERVCARALEDVQGWFPGASLEQPRDWLDVVSETELRPCRITHDVFERTA